MRVAPLALGLVFAWLPSSAAAQDQVLQAGQQYQSGTRVSSPLTGVSFAIPDGFIGMYDAEGQAFVMGSQAQSDLIVGVYAFSEATVEDISGEVVRLLGVQGVSLVPRDEGEITDSTASGMYLASSAQGQGMLYGAVRTSAQGNAVAVAALRVGQSDTGLEQLVDGIVTSVRFGPAGALQWRQMVAGAVLSSTASGSDMSTGGATATGASSSQSSLDLCGNGQYGYQERSETYVSIEGASASSESSDEHTGQWWLVSDIIGSAILVLEAIDGRVFHWSVVEEAESVLLDGDRYYMGRSQRCF